MLNDVGTKPLVVEFFHGASCPNVFQAKPYLVTNIVLRSFILVGIMTLGYVVSGLDSMDHTSLVAHVILDMKLSKDSNWNSWSGSNLSQGFNF